MNKKNKHVTTALGLKSISETDLTKTYRYIATKEISDRDDDIVRIAGINLKNMHKNMPSFFNHNTNMLLGKVSNAFIKDDELIVDIEVLKDATLPSNVKVTDAIDSEVLNAVSMGFMVEDYKNIPDSFGWDITKSELLEVSLVSIPANPAALRVKNLFIDLIDNSDDKKLKQLLSIVEKTNEATDPKPTIKTVDKELAKSLEKLFESKFKEFETKIDDKLKSLNVNNDNNVDLPKTDDQIMKDLEKMLLSED